MHVSSSARRGIATLSALLAVGLSPLSPSARSSSSAAAYEEQVLALVNRHRASGVGCTGRAGAALPPLVMHDRLRQAARGHSERMAAGRFYSHVSPDGRSFGDRIYLAGYAGAFPWGENIAAGYETPAAVVDAWMRTGGHCEQIMSPRYRSVGIGYAYLTASPFGHYWTQTFGGG